MRRVFAFLLNYMADPVRRDDRGVTAVEYAILLTVLGLVLITTLTLFASQIVKFFPAFIKAL
jgi:Flp pilus assembly pilin Flp